MDQCAGQSATDGVLAVDAGWFVNANFSLWRNPELASTNWTRLANAPVQNRGASVRLTDPQPPFGQGFYRVADENNAK